ncbi:MAG: hypothetical protein M5U15_13660 [Kiritimatiellae bacterium]|nr:hypothetical protein [Kiritimatiellia bacterium]
MTQFNHLTGIASIVITSRRACVIMRRMNRVIIAATVLVAALAAHGCAARQPGYDYRWTSHHSAVGGDDGTTTYIGIGRTF